MSEIPNPRDRRRRPQRQQDPYRMSEGEYYAVWGGLGAAMIIFLAIWSFFTFVFPAIAAWFMAL